MTEETEAAWVLVPRVPTEAMIEAYCQRLHALGFHAWVNASTVWEAMLAAVPTQTLAGAPVPVGMDMASRDQEQAVSGVVDELWRGDLWWIANDPESGFGDAYDAYEAATEWDDPGDPVQLTRAVSLPDVWAVRVTLSRDDAGDPDETEVQLFATKAEANAASAVSMTPPALGEDSREAPLNPQTKGEGA